MTVASADFTVVQSDRVVIEKAIAAASAADIAVRNMDEIYDPTSGSTMRQYLRLSAAPLFGVSSGAATNTVTYFSEDGTTPRVVATVTSSGDRTGIALTKA